MDRAEHVGSLPWVDVQITVPPCPNNPRWLGWVVDSDGQTPWEDAQVVALEVLLEICQDYGDELVNGPAGSFPGVSVTDTFVSQIGTEPLEMREAILGYSSSPAMSAMLPRHLHRSHASASASSSWAAQATQACAQAPQSL